MGLWALPAGIDEASAMESDWFLLAASEAFFDTDEGFDITTNEAYEALSVRVIVPFEVPPCEGAGSAEPFALTTLVWTP